MGRGERVRRVGVSGAGGDETAAAGEFAPDAAEEGVAFAVVGAVGPIGVVVVLQA